MHPLEGVRVLELATLIAGPSAGMLLVHLGADVIKVERLTGDPGRNLRSVRSKQDDWAPPFLAANLGKRSIGLDLSSDAGRRIALELIANSDVVIDNAKPGSLARLSLDPDVMTKTHQGLIWISVVGFGAHGPERERPAVDLIVQAESGIMSTTGFPDGEPLRTGFLLIDAVAAHVVVEAALAALISRGRTGEGQRLTVSLLDVGVQLQAANMTEYLQTGVEPPRVGNSSPFSAPADALRTQDGFVVLSAYFPQHWTALCKVIGRTDLAVDDRFATSPARVQHRAELIAELEQTFATEPSSHWVSLLTPHGVMVGEVASYATLAQREQLRVNHMFLSGITSGGKEFRTVSPPYAAGSSPLRGATVPALGQHTVEILQDLGRSAAEVAELVRAGVVVAASSVMPESPDAGGDVESATNPGDLRRT